MNEWELAAWGGGCDFEIRCRPDGRWVMRYVTARRSGAQGEPAGYATREDAVRAAARYASP